MLRIAPNSSACKILIVLIGVACGSILAQFEVMNTFKVVNACREVGLLAFVGASALLFASPANAVLIEGSITGTITSSHEATIASDGNWNRSEGALDGQIATGTFTFDTDDLPVDDYPDDSDTNRYAQNGLFNWLNITFAVGTNTYSAVAQSVGDDYVETETSAGESFDVAFISDGSLDGDSSNDTLVIREHFDTTYLNSENVAISHRSMAGIYLNGGDADFLNGLSLEQTLGITDFSLFGGTYAIFDDFRRMNDRNSGSFVSGTQFGFRFDLTSFSMAAVGDHSEEIHDGHEKPHRLILPVITDNHLSPSCQ